MNIPDFTATQLVEAYRKHELSPLEVANALVEHTESMENEIEAWAHWDPEISRARAGGLAADQQENSNASLYGVPIGVKDVFNTKDFPTEMGSLIWKGFHAGNDARIVFNLLYDGGFTFGKTTTSEFAVHHPTKTRNPHDLERTPGTSSAGSAAAVACGMVPVALGTQTGGSITRPASYCGVYGYKPTFGLIPRTGVLKTTDTLDTIGWFARSVEDIELLFESARVKGLDYPVVNEKVQPRSLPENARVGIYRGPLWQGADSSATQAFEEAVEKIQKQTKWEFEEFNVPDFESIYKDHELIYCKALSYYFKAEVRSAKVQISDVLNDMLDRGDMIAPDEYIGAIERQSKRTREMDKLFTFDFGLTLSAYGEAPVGLDAPDIPDSCKVWTYLGMPALNIPALKGAAGKPVGLQIIGRKYSDYDVLKAGQMIADRLGFGEGIPPVTTSQTVRFA
ncbi:MAG: amidase [Verrucomicrobiota bacterium]